MNKWLRAAAAAQLLAWSAVHADTARPALADPADPKVVVPESKYQSAFEGYRGYDDVKPRSWREANEEAGALRGHMGQLRGRPPERKEGGVPRGAGSQRGSR